MNTHQLSRMVEQGLAQLQGWDATTDSIYAFAGMVIVYIFILITRDQTRAI